MTTTWNPSDQSGLTLSNGNLTANGGPSGAVGGRGTTGHSTGKWVLGYSAVALPGNTADYVGVGSLAAVIGSLVALQANQIIMSQNGSAFSPGEDGSPHVGADCTTGSHEIDFAIDFDGDEFWIRSDGGSWLGVAGTPGDPTVPGSGVPIGGVTAALYPYNCLFGSTGSTVTINHAVASIPAGYAEWDNGPPPPQFCQARVIT